MKWVVLIFIFLAVIVEFLLIGLLFPVCAEVAPFKVGGDVASVEGTICVRYDPPPLRKYLPYWDANARSGVIVIRAHYE